MENAKKIGSMKNLLVCILLFSPVVLLSQDVRVSLSSNKSEVGVGERFNIVVSANIEGSAEINLPPEFTVIAQMSGKSSQSINGKSSLEITKTITAVASKQGNFTIPPVIWTYKSNKKVKSNTLNIKVTQSSGSTSANTVANNTTQNSSGKHFGVLVSSMKEVYVGEPFVLTGKVYFDGHILDVNSYQQYQQDLMVHKTNLVATQGLTVEPSDYGGKMYESILLFDELLVAQQHGELNFDAFSLNVIYQKGVFGSAYQMVRSNGLVIRVLPLPDGAPSGFSGGVGKFDVLAKTDAKANMKAGDVFTYTVRIAGLGNLHLLKPVELILPKGLILYGDPEVENSVITAKKGAHGHLEYEFIIQIQEPGAYDFTPFQFAYFNPETKQYYSSNVDNIQMEVSGVMIDDLTNLTQKNASVDVASSPWKNGIILLLTALLVGVGVFYFLKKNRTAPSKTAAKKNKVDAHRIALDGLLQIQNLEESQKVDALEKVIIQFFKDFTQNDELLLDADWFTVASKQYDISEDLSEAWSKHFAAIQAIKYGGFGAESAEDLVNKTKTLVG